MSPVDLPRLLVRSQPLETDNLATYLQRLSALNGYDSPRWIAPPERNVKWNEARWKRLSGMTGDSVERLLHLASGDEFLAFGAGLPGVKLPRLQWAVAGSKACPECVADGEIAWALWDLRVVTACPVHGCRLVHSCPDCGTKLRLNRPAPSRCASLRCSSGPGLADRVAAPKATVDLVRALARTAGHRSAPRADRLRSLERLELNEALRLIEELAFPIERHRKRRNLLDPLGTVDIVAEALSDLPASFEAYLERVADRIGGTSRYDIVVNFPFLCSLFLWVDAQAARDPACRAATNDNGRGPR